MLKVTAPVSKLLSVKVMGLEPALKLEVPGTVKIPVCVMAPADIEIASPLAKVTAGKAMAPVPLVVRPVSGVPPPTAVPKLMVPVPADNDKVLAPLMVLLKVIPLFVVVRVSAAPNCTGPV